MLPHALSAASIGQVHRSWLPDGTAVAVKVLYPGLAAIIEKDLRPAMFASRIAPRLRALLGQIQERLIEECDYVLEAERQARFRGILEGHPTLIVPEVHLTYSSSRVLTTTFVEGVHLDRYLAGGPPQAARDRAGQALFDFYFAPLFKRGIYNGDPHPGNYLFCADGRVGVVDFGCARVFEPEVVRHLAALTDAVLGSHPDRIHPALVGLGLEPGITYDRAATHRLLRAFFGPLAHDRDPHLRSRGGDLAQRSPRERVEGAQPRSLGRAPLPPADAPRPRLGARTARRARQLAPPPGRRRRELAVRCSGGRRRA